MKQNRFIPGPYFYGFFHGLDSRAERYGLEARTFQTGQTLTKAGEINNTAWLITKGTVSVSLTASNGNHRALAFFGGGTVFPIGVVPHVNLIDYEMVMTVIEPVSCYPCPYPDLRRMVEDDGKFGAKILEQNCQFIGYLFYQSLNRSTGNSVTKTADVLYLLYRNVYPDGRIPTSQSALASLIGISRPQLERVLKTLRERRCVETGRNAVRVHPDALLSLCSDDMKLYAERQPQNRNP